MYANKTCWRKYLLNICYIFDIFCVENINIVDLYSLSSYVLQTSRWDHREKFQWLKDKMKIWSGSSVSQNKYHSKMKDLVLFLEFIGFLGPLFTSPLMCFNTTENNLPSIFVLYFGKSPYSLVSLIWARLKAIDIFFSSLISDLY